METTNPLLNISVSQLRKAAELKERIDVLNNELAALLGGTTPSIDQTPATEKRGMSAAGREKVAEAARARWAKIRAAKGGASDASPSTTSAPAKKRTMSLAARKKIAAAAKARWARVRAEKMA